ncbi:MAG: NrfD/PsrC family molybdoenzyme membrane anchor subunit [Nitriliruptorales bacterium]|nr:NrfD/PsrC family molybdoenzyme membrane anchor subunit [Nitriliruptorales bacterium]
MTKRRDIDTRPRPESLADAALSTVTGRHRGATLLLILLGMPVLAAVAAFGYQVAQGGLSVTDLNDQFFWGLYEADLVTFIGFSYGGALVSAILRLTNAQWRGPIVRLAEGTALITLAIGAVFPIIHLGHPERVWQLFTRPQLQSPLVWDMVAILTYLLATLLLFCLPLIPDAAAMQDRPELGRARSRLYRLLSLGWRGTPRQRATLERALTILAIAIIPIAVMVHTVLSYAFSLTSRPGWHSTIFGPYFVVGAIYSGVAIVIVAAVVYRKVYGLQQWMSERSIRSLAYIMVALGALYGYLFFSEVTTEGYVGSEEAQTLLYGLLLGEYAPLTWAFVALGLVVPILLVAMPRTRTMEGIGVAALLVAVAMWLKRFLIVVPPLSRPLIGGDAATYSPTAVEWTITIGAFAAIPFLLILLFRFLPVLAIDEIEGAEPPAETEPDPASVGAKA